MSHNSKIEWCDATWNVVAGCTKCSPGCKNCYAERMARRLRAICKSRMDGRNQQYLGKVDDNGDWTGNIECCDWLLDEPLSWRKPRRIFVCSMSDLFHPKVPFEFIDKMLYVMYRNLQHTFLILTKRPKRMLEYFKNSHLLRLRLLKLFPNYTPEARLCREWPLDNVHLSVSISTFDEMWKAEVLSEIPATVRFISFEPLLENIFNIPCKLKVLDKIDCVIVGGESGPGARPMHPDWARNIRDQCVAAGVPFYFKQWGEWMPDDFENGGIIESESLPTKPTKTAKESVGWGRRLYTLSDGTKFVAQQDQFCNFIKVGKKKAGCILDDKEWKQLPK